MPESITERSLKQMDGVSITNNRRLATLLAILIILVIIVGSLSREPQMLKGALQQQMHGEIHQQQGISITNEEKLERVEARVRQ